MPSEFFYEIREYNLSTGEIKIEHDFKYSDKQMSDDLVTGFNKIKGYYYWNVAVYTGRS